MRFHISPFALWSAFLLFQVETKDPTYHDQRFVPDFELRVSSSLFSQSCLPAKEVVLINGTSPGPTIRLKTERTYWIRVHNDLTKQNTTMHWHGLTMATAPFSDGTPAASQWPIPPGYFFDYEIRVPAGMEGSYFYHSHVGFQAVSASGPLIIDGPKRPPFDFNEERLFFIQDVFQKNDSTIESGLVVNPLQWSGESAMILVNGKGGGAANGTYCNSTLSVIHVEANKTYYFRFIGATALTFASLLLEDHEFEIVEVDGFYVKNHPTPLLQIAAGQRFGVLLRTKIRPSRDTYAFQIESRDRPTVTRSFAILSYNASLDQTFYPANSSLLNVPEVDLNFLEYMLEARDHEQVRDFPSAADVTRRVTIVAHQRVEGPTTWINNNYSWTDTFPTQPYLVSLYDNDTALFPSFERASANQGIDPVTRTFPARLNEVLEIVIQNTGGDTGGLDAHPWHAHGPHYYDMGSGNGTYDPVTNDRKWIELGRKPVKRDTTMLYRYGKSTGNGTEQGWRAWRVRLDEPGVWMVHCHILQHLLMGMQTVWVVGDRQDVLSRVGYPDVVGYLAFGGSVVGNETRWPTVNEFF